MFTWRSGSIFRIVCRNLFHNAGILRFVVHWLIRHHTPSEEEIDEAAFKCLKYDMIKEIIPRIGKRAKFLQRYEEYKENLTERPAFAELQLEEKVRTGGLEKGWLRWFEVENHMGCDGFAVYKLSFGQILSEH